MKNNITAEMLIDYASLTLSPKKRKSIERMAIINKETDMLFHQINIYYECNKEYMDDLIGVDEEESYSRDELIMKARHQKTDVNHDITTLVGNNTHVAARLLQTTNDDCLVDALKQIKGVSSKKDEKDDE